MPDAYVSGLRVSGTGELYTTPVGSYPALATPVTGTSGNVAAGIAAASLPAVAGKTNYVTGFEVSSSGATAAAVVLAVLSGLITGSMTYVYATVAGAAVGNPTLVVQFSTPIPASAVNTAITMTLPSLGAGNLNSCVNIHGYVL